MALKTRAVTISEDGRDQGKTYIITEKPAMQAAKWVDRLFLAMARAGVDVPKTIIDAGIVGVALLGINALAAMQWADAEALLDEMMACVTVVPMPGTPEFTRPLADGDVEEIMTVMTLRAEVLTLHTGFTLADVRSALMAAQQTTADQPSPSTQTSPA